jgi:hypothetical protein
MADFDHTNFDIRRDVHSSLWHPTDPTLFMSSEGYVTADYVTQKVSQIECTFSLWSNADGEYLPAPPVIYENLTREEAFTKIIYALNTGDPAVNRWQKRYSAVRTRELA